MFGIAAIIWMAFAPTLTGPTTRPATSQPTEDPPVLTLEQLTELSKLEAHYESWRITFIRELTETAARLVREQKGRSKSSREANARQIRELRQFADKLRFGREPVVPLLEWKVDSIGIIPDSETWTVFQVVNDELVLLKDEDTDRMCFFGLNTKNLTDEARVNLSDHVFAVRGTQTYETAIGGTNTVFVLTPVDQVVVDRFLGTFPRKRLTNTDLK